MNNPTPREVWLKVEELDRRYEQRFRDFEKATSLAHGDAKSNIALLVALVAAVISVLAIYIR